MPSSIPAAATPVPSWARPPSVGIASVVGIRPIESRAIKGRTVIATAIINGFFVIFVIIVLIDRRTFDNCRPSLAALAVQIRRFRGVRR
jgi:hypothetical protein